MKKSRFTGGRAASAFSRSDQIFAQIAKSLSAYGSGH